MEYTSLPSPEKFHELGALLTITPLNFGTFHLPAFIFYFLPHNGPTIQWNKNHRGVTSNNAPIISKNLLPSANLFLLQLFLFLHFSYRIFLHFSQILFSILNLFSKKLTLTMFIVCYFTGGTVEHGPCGVQYSKRPTSNFTVHDDITLGELETELYRCMGISRSTHNLEISGRFNKGMPPVMFYSELQIINNDMWRLFVNHSVRPGGLCMVELFVEPKPLFNAPNQGFASSSQFRSDAPNQGFDSNSQIPDEPSHNNSYEPNATSNRNISVPNENDDLENFEFQIGLDELDPTERVENLVSEDQTPIGNTCGDDHFMDMDFTPYENPNYNSEEDEGNENPNDNLEEESSESMTSWPLRDRSDSHPVASWNDINALVDIVGDGNYFNEEGYVTEDGLAVGQCFRTKDHLKWVVHDFHIKANRTFYVAKVDKKTYTLECTDQDCPWRLYATRRPSDEAFIIRTRMGPHVCVISMDRLEHPHLTAPFMASIIREHVKRNVRYTIKDIKVSIEQRYNFKAPYQKCWRAKEIAIAQLFGGWRQAYDLIHPLLTAIQRTNPGTKVEWVTDPTRDPNKVLFQGVYWAYGPAIEAFKYLRPVIGIDGTFLSGRYGGRLFVACGFDAEDQLVPLAFALVDAERNETWKKFMKFVRREVIGMGL